MKCVNTAAWLISQRLPTSTHFKSVSASVLMHSTSCSIMVTAKTVEPLWMKRQNQRMMLDRVCRFVKTKLMLSSLTLALKQ